MAASKKRNQTGDQSKRSDCEKAPSDGLYSSSSDIPLKWRIKSLSHVNKVNIYHCGEYFPGYWILDKEGLPREPNNGKRQCIWCKKPIPDEIWFQALLLLG